MAWHPSLFAIVHFVIEGNILITNFRQRSWPVVHCCSVSLTVVLLLVVFLRHKLKGKYFVMLQVSLPSFCLPHSLHYKGELICQCGNHQIPTVCFICPHTFTAHKPTLTPKFFRLLICQCCNQQKSVLCFACPRTFDGTKAHSYYKVLETIHQVSTVASFKKK